MNKRGQVTIYIIIAILIVIFVICYLLVSKNQIINPPSTPSQDIKVFIQDCLEKTSKDAVVVIGVQGGYYKLPENKIEYYSSEIPVYIDKNRKLIPSIEEVEKQINLYIQSSLPECFDSVSGVSNQGSVILNNEKIVVNSQISKDRVDIQALIPVIFEKSETTENFKDFSTVVQPVKIPLILEVSDSIANEQTKNPKEICMSCLAEIAEEKELLIDIFETGDKREFVYTLVDLSSNLSLDTPYQFNFGARYDFPDCNSLEGCSR